MVALPCTRSTDAPVRGSTSHQTAKSRRGHLSELTVKGRPQTNGRAATQESRHKIRHLKLHEFVGQSDFADLRGDELAALAPAALDAPYQILRRDSDRLSETRIYLSDMTVGKIHRRVCDSASPIYLPLKGPGARHGH